MVATASTHAIATVLRRLLITNGTGSGGTCRIWPAANAHVTVANAWSVHTLMTPPRIVRHIGRGNTERGARLRDRKGPCTLSSHEDGNNHEDGKRSHRCTLFFARRGGSGVRSQTGWASDSRFACLAPTGPWPNAWADRWWFDGEIEPRSTTPCTTTHGGPGVGRVGYAVPVGCRGLP